MAIELLIIAVEIPTFEPWLVIELAMVMIDGKRTAMNTKDLRNGDNHGAFGSKCFGSRSNLNCNLHNHGLLTR